MITVPVPDKRVPPTPQRCGHSNTAGARLGLGFYRGSSILISGTAGTGKSSIAAYFANAVCRRKERCIYFAFEESPKQIIRNMKSIGLNLEPHVKSELLQFHSSRPSLYGLERHLASIYKLVRTVKPAAVILDPVTNLVSVGLVNEVNSMLLRLIDFLQNEGITVMLTALTGILNERMDEGVSSLVDTWISVRDIEANGERNRTLYIMKSRGMKHSNKVREFMINDKGLNLVDAFRGDSGNIIIGSEREMMEKQKRSGNKGVKSQDKKGR